MIGSISDGDEGDRVQTLLPMTAKIWTEVGSDCSGEQSDYV